MDDEQCQCVMTDRGDDVELCPVHGWTTDDTAPAGRRAAPGEMGE